MTGDSNDPILGRIREAGPRPPVPHDRAERVRAAVAAHWRREVGAARRRRAVLWAVAGAAAAAVLVVVLGRTWRAAPGPAETGGTLATVLRAEGSVRTEAGALAAGARLEAWETVTTGPGGRAALGLASGGSARLDSETRVILAGDRLLRLDHGALYFDSAGRPARAGGIIVQTEMGEVRDVGTQFEVRIQGGALRLSVREGTARLTRPQGPTLVAAGTRVLITTTGTTETASLATAGPDWDWVEGIAPAFDLEGRTLGAYLDWLARETGWTVRFADPAMAARAREETLHGSIEGLRPDETPAAVLPTCGLRHALTGGTLVLERVTGPGGSRR